MNFNYWITSKVGYVVKKVPKMLTWFVNALLPEYLIVPWNLQFEPPIFRSLTKMSTPANCGLWYLHWHLVWYWQHFLFWHFVKIFPVKFCKKDIAGINFLFSITPLITFFMPEHFLSMSISAMFKDFFTWTWISIDT